MSLNQVQNNVEEYRKKVEEAVVDGEISDIISESLEAERKKVGIAIEQASVIQAEVLKPYQEYRNNLEKYLQYFVQAMNRESFISDKTRHGLKQLQQTWKLKNKDIDEIYNSLGNALYNKDQDKAIIAYKEALWINKNNAVTHSILGNILWGQGEIEEAIAEYREAIFIEPDNAKFHAHLGNIFYSQARLDEAIAEYKKAIDIKPNDGEFYNHLGLALYSQDKLDEAIAEYRKAIDINSNLAEAHGGLGIVLYRKGNLEEAITSFNTAINIESENCAFHRDLGRVLYSQGKLKEAVDKLRKAIRINPNDAITYTYLVLALLKQGKHDEAKDELEYARDLYIKQGMTQESEQIYQTLQQEIAKDNINLKNLIRRFLFW